MTATLVSKAFQNRERATLASPDVVAVTSTDQPSNARAGDHSSSSAPSACDPKLATARFLRLISHDFARQHLILSQGEIDDGRVEKLAIAAQSSPAAVFNSGTRLGVSVETRVGEAETIAAAIDEAYGSQHCPGEVQAASMSNASSDVDRLLAESDRDLLSTQGKGPVIKLVDALLFEALGRGASDVHIQPLAAETLVRYRLDGVLHAARVLPAGLAQPVVSRIKVMGKMDIAERRVPQDGRSTVAIGERRIDLRISTLPTSYGERLVIRLLDNTNNLCEFDRLGMPAEVAGPFLECARRANGMILLTGPTGSGKTTTLYSTLRTVGSAQLNIMTIEDPIEYELSNPQLGLAISQSQVNPRKGVTFATGLRHILRQDPDVIMVGEIRDGETARIAIQSSLTGHLVFSTLHTNDSASAVTRLVDLGIEPYLVGASLSAVLAQRLVRKVHAACEGRGCSACFSTGFSGRTGLFELLIVEDEMRHRITAAAPLAEIRQLARRAGMRTLREDGQRLVNLSITTQPEVARVVEGAL